LTPSHTFTNNGTTTSAIGDGVLRFRNTDYFYAPLSETGPIAYLRAWLTNSQMRPQTIAKARTNKLAAAAARQLNNELALGPQLDHAWAMKPLGSTTGAGSVVLLYDDSEIVSLEKLAPHMVPIPCFIQLASALAQVVASMHGSGLIHRNINPACFFIDVDATTNVALPNRIRIGGFGLACAVTSADDKIDDMVALVQGELPYMSPEHSGRTQRPIDLRSDLYALGLVFYRLLSGHLPFGVSGVESDAAEWIHFHIASDVVPPRLLRKEVPELVSQIVMRLLEKDPDRRYQSASQLHADLERSKQDWHSATPDHLQPSSLFVSDNTNLTMLPGLSEADRLTKLTRLAGAAQTIAQRLFRNEALPQLRMAINDAMASANGCDVCDVSDMSQPCTFQTLRLFIDALSDPASFNARDSLLLSDNQPSFAPASHTVAGRYVANLYLAILHYHAHEYQQAAQCMADMKMLSVVAMHLPDSIEVIFFNALILAANDIADVEREKLLPALRQDCEKIIQPAAGNSPIATLQAHLLQGEIARLEGNVGAALVYYEQAVSRAESDEHWYYHGLAHELAARLSLREGWQTALKAHLASAHAAYMKWGALGLAAQLTQRYPYSAGMPSIQENPEHHATQASIKNLESVIRATRILSEELRLDAQIQAIMSVTLEHVGAERGLLIRCNQELPYIEASARTTSAGITVNLQPMPPTEADLPLTMLQQVLSTGKQVVSDSCTTKHGASFSAVCVPMFKHGHVIGALYLENRILPAAFTVEHTQILQLLAAQAAISLETARLYAALLDENTQRIAVEKALRASQTSLILGEQFNHIGSVRYLLKEGVMFCSAELCRIYGLEAGTESISYEEFSALLHPDDRKMVLDIIEAAVAEAGTIRVEHRICRSNGEVRYISGIGKPFYVDGKFNEYVGTATDITSRRQAEDALRMAQADLARVSRATTVGQLTASIAHEINQPLMSIVSNAGASLRWLDRIPPQIDNAMEGLRGIVTEGQRVGDMIQSLQRLTRNTEPVFERINLNAAIRHILAISRGEIERRDISLVLALTQENLHVLGDFVQIQQVLLNLVINAIEAMAEIKTHPRVLSISSISNGEHICIAIEDTGEGIAADIVTRVFDAFYTTKKNGMGMGLAICQSIIENHHGRLQAQRRAPCGSRFSFELPLTP